MHSIKLRDGVDVSILALGGSPFGDVYGKLSQTRIDATVAAAIKSGINLIDVAPYYGLTTAETRLGNALKAIAPSKYKIATKVGRYGDHHWDFSRDATLRSVEASLQRLHCERINILQCHDIEAGNYKQLIDEAIPVLRELKDQGLVDLIGITGYNLKLLESVAIEQRLDTVMAYCTFTLQDRRLAATAKRLWIGHNIVTFNASPLGMGLLTSSNPPDWHPATMQVKQLAREAARVCAEAGTTISTLALQFAVHHAQENCIASTIVGSASSAQVIENIAALSKPLDTILLKQVEEILKPVMNVGWTAANNQKQAAQ